MPTKTNVASGATERRPRRGQKPGVLSVVDGLLRTPPVVFGEATRAAGRQVWSLRIKCPWCNKWHTHGGGSGPEPQGGHRLGHCADTRGRSFFDKRGIGYIIAFSSLAEVTDRSG